MVIAVSKGQESKNGKKNTARELGGDFYSF